MYNLGLGGLGFSSEHTLDEHRPVGYKVSEINTDVVLDHTELTNSNRQTTESAVEANTAADVSTGATIHEPVTDYIGDKDYNIIKLMNVFGNKKQQSVFRTMHDPFHRHPRHHSMYLQYTCDP